MPDGDTPGHPRCDRIPAPLPPRITRVPYPCGIPLHQPGHRVDLSRADLCVFPAHQPPAQLRGKPAQRESGIGEHRQPQRGRGRGAHCVEGAAPRACERAHAQEDHAAAQGGVERLGVRRHCRRGSDCGQARGREHGLGSSGDVRSESMR